MTARLLALLSLVVGCGCAREAPRAWRLVSYNVWGVPFTVDQPKRMERLPESLRALEPAVICLQEVWLAADRERLQKAFEPRWRVADAAGGGLVLASVFPIRDARFTRFPVFEGLPAVEKVAGKGWLEATLDTPDGPVRVVTTHLALQGPRRLQLEALLDALDARRDVPTVLAGDFNTSGSHEDFGLFAAHGWRDARPPVAGAGAGADRTADDGPPTRVGWPRTGADRGWSPDHVFVRGLSASRTRLALDTPETALSDHNLLHVDVLR